MSIMKFSAVALCAALSFPVVSARAASLSVATSPVTARFLDNVTPNVDFLDRSSRIAILDTKDTKLRDYAKATATDATNTANALYDWSQAGKTGNGAEAPLQTGRSAAVDQVPDNRLPRGQEDIDALYGSEGVEFSTQYRQAQIDALTQVQADYQDYIAHGDDPTLKALAVRELPKVTKRLAAAQKI